LKRLLRAARQKWKRLRRGLKKQRNEAEFRTAQAELATLREQLRRGSCEFEVWYFDEAGFSLTACVPYAWQAVGERLELESRGNQGKRQNVLGFLRWDGGDFYAAVFEGSINNHLVGGCFRSFAKEKKSAKPKLIILDNAPAHRGEEFEEELAELEKMGVFVLFLPSYSPELNLIELLWRKIKYEWLPLDIYGSYQTMCEGLFEVLKGIGSKYRIIFG
jgi:transposase